ncbi:MAG: dienelactone hydrolase family protein, partial [Candidatus Limnocylindrales bacterium]
MGAFATLKAGDRTARVFVAGEPRPGSTGVLLLHAWWGLSDDVVAYAGRLAGEGFVVVAPDLFGGHVAITIEDAERISSTADEAAIQAIVLAAIDLLTKRLGQRAPLAAIGFSFGAAWAIWAPTQRDRIGATVVYYGTWTGSILGRARTPVLGHFAEDDPYESAGTVTEFGEGLRAAGREAVIHVYPGTGHW